MAYMLSFRFRVARANHRSAWSASSDLPLVVHNLLEDLTRARACVESVLLRVPTILSTGNEAK